MVSEQCSERWCFGGYAITLRKRLEVMRTERLDHLWLHEVFLIYGEPWSFSLLIQSELEYGKYTLSMLGCDVYDICLCLKREIAYYYFEADYIIIPKNPLQN